MSPVSPHVITVFGATGFVGRNLVAALAKTGAVIRVATRNTSRAFFLKPYGAVGQIVPVACDVRSDESVRAALDGATAAVNLVGILHEKGGSTYNTVHADVPGRIARTAAALGLRRFVHVSAIGASLHATSNYHRSKFRGERAVMDSFPRATVLRSSLIFGSGDGFFPMFSRMASRSPVLPMIGGGRTLFQPVYVKNVVDAIVTSLSDDTSRGRIYELGGPKIYSFRDLLTLMLDTLGKKRVLMPLPAPIAYCTAWMCEWLPRPPLTRDQIKSLRTDIVVSDDALTLYDLNIHPTALEAILPAILETFRPGAKKYASRSLTLLAACTLAALCAASSQTHAQSAPRQQNTIAAVVNGDAISTNDVLSRTRLVMMGANLPPTAEVAERLKPQILNTLINESLQMQEARALDITVTDEQVAQAIQTVARNNNVDPATFPNILMSNGINITTLQDQLRAEIAWGQVVRRKLAPQVNISEADIDATLDQLESSVGQKEYLLAEIFVRAPEGNADADAAARQKIEGIVAALQAGEKFQDLALKNSDAPGAQRGGDMGWIKSGQLDPVLDEAIAAMPAGTLSMPLRSRDGYHLILVRNVRDVTNPLVPVTAPASVAPVVPPAATPAPAPQTVTETVTAYDIKQIFVPIGADESEAVSGAKVARLRQLKSDVADCAAMNTAMEDFPHEGTKTFMGMKESDMAPGVRDAIAAAGDNTLTDPIVGADGVVVIMVCARNSETVTVETEAPPADTPAEPVVAAAAPSPAPAAIDRNNETLRDGISSRLGETRLRSMQDQYLKDLRATAFIEKRI